MKHAIKHRYTEAVLFECDVPEDVPAGLRTRHALEKATAERADLRGAYLRDAYLSDADLRDAYLSDAHLRGAYLRGADLSGADLSGADLSGAYLRGADLRDADLRDAYLSDAYLSDAYLSGADLRGAYLRGADLSGADLGGAHLRGEQKLVSKRPIFQVGPIGSRSDYLVAYITDAGVMLRAGCFFGTVAEFEQKCAETHGDNEHAQEYKAALALIAVHAKLWGDA